MSNNDNIFARLTTDSTLGPLVSNGDSPETFRAYPMLIPQGPTYPLIRYQNIIADPQNHLTGESDIKNDRIQIDAFAEEYDEAQTVADAIEGAMVGGGDGFQGLRQNRIDLEFDADIGIFQVSLEFSIWY